MKFPFSGYQCMTDEYSYIKALISKKKCTKRVRLFRLTLTLVPIDCSLRYIHNVCYLLNGISL